MLAVRTVERAVPEGDQVLIRVATAGVAYGDLLLREGLVPGAGSSPVPGYDVVGVVEEAGPTARFSPGDRVAAWTGGTGGYTTRALVSDRYVVIVPDSVTDETASALVLTYITAWQMLTRASSVGEGGTILVHGATGAVGQAVVELARLRGLRVIGTGSSRRLAALSGDDFVGVDRAGDWSAEVRRAASDGVDAAFDGVGGRVGRRSLSLLRTGGTLVVYGATGALRNGRRSIVGLAGAALGSAWATSMGLFVRGIGIQGYVSTRFVADHPAWFASDLTLLLELAAEERIAPRIAATLPMERAAEAHRMLARGVEGKVILRSDS
ncbi:zinc-binding dehydrogenase [Xylanimonas oleitrophica]|uniref:zinc-binding dehydrogenase n=1 Tax=Xylanimonas oleitrophica TaxID=2607479 RepID=UPI0015D0429D|nr:zinc-binding dehydrogenase [Xylanimonas oleitrophica]